MPHTFVLMTLKLLMPQQGGDQREFVGDSYGSRL